MLSRLSVLVARLERIASRLLIFGFVSLIVVNVTMRYVAGMPIIFAEELAAIMLAWLVFVSISLSIHERSQIAITLLTDRLPRGVALWLDRSMNVLIAAMLVVLLWKSVEWLRSPVVEFEQIITVGWAKAPFFTVVPIFCVTSLLHVLAHLFSDRVREVPA